MWKSRLSPHPCGSWMSQGYRLQWLLLGGSSIWLELCRRMYQLCYIYTESGKSSHESSMISLEVYPSMHLWGWSCTNSLLILYVSVVMSFCLRWSRLSHPRLLSLFVTLVVFLYLLKVKCAPQHWTLTM